MAGSVNKVILVGNLGQDPEVRSTQGGVKVVTLSIATSETWRDRDSGDRKERTEWHRVVVFGGSAENAGMAGVAEQYLKKGSKVYVEGQLQTRKWQDDKGADRYSTEVVLKPFNGALTLLESRDGGGNRPPPANSPEDYGRASSRSNGGGSGAQASSSADDIPFAPEVR